MNKRLLAILASTLMVSAFDTTVAAQNEGDVEAQQERHREHRGMRGQGSGDPSRMLRMLSRHLDLDDTQTQAISNILDASQPEIDALRESASANRQAIRALDVGDADYGAQLQNLAATSGELATQSVLLHGKVRADVQAVLTPEQVQQLAERDGKRGGPFRHRRGGNEAN